MKRTFATLGLAALAALLACPDALARGPGRGWGRGGGAGWGGGRGGPCALAPGATLRADPQLTAHQEGAIAELREARVNEETRAQARLDQLREEMAELWSVEDPDRRAILAKHDAMDGPRRKLREARVDFHLRLLALLTPEQRSSAGPWGCSRGQRAVRGPQARGGGRGMGSCMGR